MYTHEIDQYTLYNSTINYAVVFKIKNKLVKRFTFPNFGGIQNKSIMNSSAPNFKKLCLALTNKSSLGEKSNKIKIKWKGTPKDIMDIFESDIKYSI